jgi:6-phosphogluconolactonase
VDDPAALAVEAAAEFSRRAREAIAARGRFAVALSGGATPRALYARLAREHAEGEGSLAWDRIHLFWSDERHVPPSHPDSNYRAALEQLISKVPIPGANIHRIQGESADAAVAALDYERELLAFFGATGGPWPRFDLVLLGMGTDGHTGSLFPGSRALDERSRLVTAPWVAPLATWRITFTPALLNAAACILFLVTGAEKAAMVRTVLEGEPAPDRYPAQLAVPREGELIWLLDRAAASLLRGCGQGQNRLPDR